MTKRRSFSDKFKATIALDALPEDRTAQNIDEWTEIFGSERLTGALLDRSSHHVHILEMNGESYRLKHSSNKKN